MGCCAAACAAALTMTLAGAVATASASTVQTGTGLGLTYAAAPGEQNTVTIDVATGHVDVADTTAPLTAGRGCDQVDAHRARCGTHGLPYGVEALLGDGDDTLTV